MKKCVECNIEFNPHLKHPGQSFCSKKCRELNIEKNNRCIDCGKSLNSRAKYSKTKRCIECENVFKKGKIPKNGFKKGHIPWNKDKCHYFLLGKRPSEQCIRASIEATKNRIVTKETRNKMRLAKVGKVGNRKGTHCSELTKKKISIGNKGTIRSEESKRRNSLSHGGTGIPYEYNCYSEKFFKIRPLILKRDNYTCQKCGQYGNKKLNYLTIHHIDYNKNNNQENNLICLCKKDNLKANFNRTYWLGFYQNKIAQLKIGGIQK